MILVVGGAGYIGSHFCKLLRVSGVEHTVFDSLEKGHWSSLGQEGKRSDLVEGDLRRPQDVVDAVRSIGERSRIEAVVHFASYIEVGESMAEPDRYWENNVQGTRNLLEAMAESGVKQIVFSSTAAVYGEPRQVPIPEDHPLQPTNVYGETKLAVEEMLEQFGSEHGLQSIRLRYFNASGADPEGELGEDHRPETHLIPRAILAGLGRVPPLKLFGTDYPTADGTCVRDYVHVWDLARAHLLALEGLRSGALGERTQSEAFNLGSGRGNSVREVIDLTSEVLGMEVPYEEAERREGDPAVLVASNEKARQVLGWNPQYTELRDMIQHAANWMKANPSGYAE